MASRCGPGDRRAGGYLFETKKAPALQMALKYYDRNIKLDRGSIRSSPRNGIGPISNKNMGFWSQ